VAFGLRQGNSFQLAQRLVVQPEDARPYNQLSGILVLYAAQVYRFQHSGISLPAFLQNGKGPTWLFPRLTEQSPTPAALADEMARGLDAALVVGGGQGICENDKIPEPRIKSLSP
jgi:hypothetical protein